MLASANHTRLYYSVRNRVVFDRSNTGTFFTEARYRANRAIFMTYARLAALKAGNGPSLRTMGKAVRDGEAGRLHDGPSLA